MFTDSQRILYCCSEMLAQYSDAESYYQTNSCIIYDWNPGRKFAYISWPAVLLNAHEHSLSCIVTMATVQ